MSRIKSKVTEVEYAGRVIYSGRNEAQSLSEFWTLSRQYSTEAAEVIDAVAPKIRAFGNASGDFPLSVCVDYDSEEDAFAAAIEWADWADQHNTGELVIRTGGKVFGWKAGVSGLNVSQSITPSWVRVTLAFSFLLGERISLGA